MRNIKGALTRKFGPLPAWGWLILFTIGVVYYRRKLSGGTTQTGTGTGSIAQTSPLMPLQPDQSYFDPAGGDMFTTPPQQGTMGNNIPGPAPRGGGGRARHRRAKPKKHHGKKTRKIKVPGRRHKGGVAHHTHHPRHRPDHEPDRKRDRKKTTMGRPVKSRPHHGDHARVESHTRESAPRHKPTHHRHKR